MRSRLLSHWRGVALSLVGVAAVGWLAATGRLGLYIHPRYFVFTVVMVVIAGAVTIAAVALLPGAPPEEHDEHDHDHDHGADAVSPLRRRLATVAAAALVVATAVALLAIPPATLTSATAENRALNASAGAPASADAPPALAGGDQSGFTVKDWAGILRQGADAQQLADATPRLVGFVLPDPDDPENVFYVARFVVTCCAVDAQPVGVPVHLPGWQDAHPVDSWVEVSGAFVENPSLASMQAVVVEPDEISAIEQPVDPYVY